MQRLPHLIIGRTPKCEWVRYWCFTSHATIFQFYMWRHRCAGRLKKKLDLRLGSHRHRHFAGFFSTCLSYTDMGPPFLRLFRETAPFSCHLRHAGNTEDVFSSKPPASSRTLNSRSILDCDVKHQRIKQSLTYIDGSTQVCVRVEREELKVVRDTFGNQESM